MQFRIRDLLLATTLLAIFLAGFLPALRQLEPDELPGASGVIAVAFVFYLVFFEGCHRLARRHAAPYWLVFETSAPWGHLFLCGAIALAFSFQQPWPEEEAFLVISVPFFSLVLLAILHRQAYVSTNGIFYQVMLFPWSIVERMPNENGELRLRLGPIWLGLVIDVPNESDQQVLESILGKNAELQADK